MTVSAPTEFEKYVAETRGGENVLDSTPETVQQTEAEVSTTEQPEIAETQESGEEGAKETESASESEATDEDDDAGAIEQPASRKKGGFQRKIERLNARIAELESRNATGGGAAEQQAETQQVFFEGEPTLAQFDGDLEKFTKATVKFHRQQEILQEQRIKQAEVWQSRVTEAAKKYDDFEEYANEPIPGLTQHGVDFIIASPVGPEIAYRLAKDSNLAKRIFGLSPVMQGAELATLARELSGTSAEPDKPKPAISKAPKPPAQLAGRSPSNPAKMPDPKNFAEYEKWRKDGGRI